MSTQNENIDEIASEVEKRLSNQRQIGDKLLMSRREAIGLAAGSLSLGALGISATGEASAQSAVGQIGTASEPVGIEGAQGNFQALEADELSVSGWNQIDVVEKGVDNTGSTDVSGDIEALAADDTLLVFPAGTYLINSTVSLDGYDGLGLVFRGGSTVKTDNDLQPIFTLGFINTQPSQNVLFKGATFDFSDAGDGAQPLSTDIGGIGIVEDVTVKGRNETFDSPGMFVAGSSTDARIQINNCDLSDGASFDTASSASNQNIGILIPTENNAQVTISRCDISEWPNNGIYASNSAGRVHIEKTRSYNNNISNFRPSPGGTVKDCVSIHDADPWGAGLSELSYRGVWSHAGHAVVENLTASHDIAAGVGVIVINDTTSLTLENCDVSTSQDYNCLFAIGSPAAERRTTVTNCSFEATGGSTFIIEARQSGMVLVDCEMEGVTGGSRSGLTIRADGVTVRGGSYESDQNPIQIFNGIGNRIEENPETVGGNASDGATRTVINGWGTNAGDPSSTGQWNTNGHQGIQVRDTTNAVNYTYINGAWVTL